VGVVKVSRKFSGHCAIAQLSCVNTCDIGVTYQLLVTCAQSSAVLLDAYIIMYKFI